VPTKSEVEEMKKAYEEKLRTSETEE